MNNIVDSIIAAKIAGDTYSTGEIDSKLAAKADEADLEELTSEFNTLNTRTFGLGQHRINHNSARMGKEKVSTIQRRHRNMFNYQ